ncbi:Oxidoreductase domain protein [Agrobacterium tumefaciens str. Kerr 14]|uniref:Oxidoreductase domain protein n=1 Tax=Agrobacterium tumefaciens str. Kerr 14 TaxID=1183424 RepID=A0A1S7SA68_AGRTU|nr:Gfo/Idh/MocA family oxidoreductase [Agrobacterium tumefaciens]CUX65317.1 Oxidoreductase domain protein [Agrobacterium tumefaciens str. Kerr 14]
MKKLRVGVVGVGTVALRGVIPHLVQDDLQDRLELAALCDPVIERAEGTAHQYGIAQAYASYDEFLQKSDVDVITLASPIGVHFEQGMKAIEAGKHVHFNKTMTTTLAEANRLIEAAGRNGVKLVSSPGEMLRPHNIKVRQMIRDGVIGKLSWAICGAAFADYHVDEPERDGAPGGKPINPAWYFKKPGGGPLYDMSVYSLHSLTGILGPARSVMAMSGIALPVREFAGHLIETEADDNTLILLEFPGNAYAVVYGTAAGTLGDPLDFSGRYYGTKGRIEGLRLNGEYFDYEGREEAVTAPDGGTQPGFGGNEWILPNIDGVHKTIPEQHVHADLMQLIDWVQLGKPSVATAEHARHVIEIIEAAFSSAATGQRIPLTTAF